MDVINPRCTRPPDSALVYSRHDANDVRLGDIVRGDRPHMPPRTSSSSVVHKMKACGATEGVGVRPLRRGDSSLPVSVDRQPHS